MRPPPRLAAILAGALLLVGALPAAAALRLAVSVLPLAEFAQRVGGDQVAVQVLVGPGQNPHSFEPTAHQVEELTRAQLFWRVGMPFEEVWLGRLQAANPGLRVLDARAGLGLEAAPAGASAHRHDDDHDHHHAHDGIDPHVWTSPPLVRLMVLRLAEALADLDPEGAEAYRANAAAYATELEALDAELRATLAPLENRRFLVYHPAWGRFAATYDLEQVAIERGGKEPGARSLAELATAARRDRVRVIFVQPQTSSRSAQTLAREIGARLVTADPLAADYASELRALARALVEAAP